MKLAIMQPYFFPYLGYFQAINLVDEYILYDNLNFIKEAWVNRNKYLLKNGSTSNLTIPLIHKSSYKKICEIEIVENNKWKKKLLKSVFLNYKKAKYFNDVYPIIEKVINSQTNKLSELNYQSIKLVCEYIGIKTKIINSCSNYFDLEEKLKIHSISKDQFPGFDECNNKIIRVLEICKDRKATDFINAIGGKSLYPKEIFSRNKINIQFIEKNEISYEQFGCPFVDNLSIIDVLMFNSIKEINVLLREFKLV